MEWKPQFDFEKSKEESDQRMLSSLETPLERLKAQVADRWSYNKKAENLYVNRGVNPPIIYQVTGDYFISVKNGKRAFYSTAKEFVASLPTEDVRRIARERNISLE